MPSRPLAADPAAEPFATTSELVMAGLITAGVYVYINLRGRGRGGCTRGVTIVFSTCTAIGIHATIEHERF